MQASEDASPAKWHLAHVTWFFETFVLLPHMPGYRLFDPRFPYCFNSYYESEGARHPRGQRGLLTRPSHNEVLAYRAHVDDGLARLFATGLADGNIASLIETGIHHEQQHQELLLTDILSLFAQSPIRPVYREHLRMEAAQYAEPTQYIFIEGGIQPIGHGATGFGWDNEYPRHDALIHPFSIADRLVTNGEWLKFMADGGYRSPLLWLADGWARAQAEHWESPLYWEQRDGQWLTMTLEGLQSVDRAAPVCHVSYYEADAFARWAGCRLPTEFEWEIASAHADARKAAGQLRAHPPRHPFQGAPRQMFGEVWQWTQSAYAPYPGYRPPPGALGEYNGKFMCSQQVLRGSSFATPEGHARPTYRNFFYPWQRWQFMGLRLAQEIG